MLWEENSHATVQKGIITVIRLTLIRLIDAEYSKDNQAVEISIVMIISPENSLYLKKSWIFYTCNNISDTGCDKGATNYR
jgi:hypothetical protein